MRPPVFFFFALLAPPRGLRRGPSPTPPTLLLLPLLLLLLLSACGVRDAAGGRLLDPPTALPDSCAEFGDLLAETPSFLEPCPPSHAHGGAHDAQLSQLELEADLEFDSDAEIEVDGGSGGIGGGGGAMPSGAGQDAGSGIGGRGAKPSGTFGNRGSGSGIGTLGGPYRPDSPSRHDDDVQSSTAQPLHTARPEGTSGRSDGASGGPSRDDRNRDFDVLPYTAQLLYTEHMAASYCHDDRLRAWNCSRCDDRAAGGRLSFYYMHTARWAPLICSRCIWDAH